MRRIMPVNCRASAKLTRRRRARSKVRLLGSAEFQLLAQSVFDEVLEPVLGSGRRLPGWVERKQRIAIAKHQSEKDLCNDSSAHWAQPWRGHLRRLRHRDGMLLGIMHGLGENVGP